jgi:hypothetical protein
MDEGSRLILLGFLILTAFMLLLLLGPLAVILVPVGLIVAGVALLLTGESDDEDAPERVNCADCGAPNPTDAVECSYCGASL